MPLAIVLEGTPGFDATLARLESRGEADFARVEPVVREILGAVRTGGDAAVQRYSERFGRRAPALVVRDYDGAAALARLPDEARSALQLAAAIEMRGSPSMNVATGPVKFFLPVTAKFRT